MKNPHSKNSGIKKRKIIFICGENKEYPRNIQALDALNKIFDVTEIISDKSSYLFRIPEVIFRFLWISMGKDYDLIYAGFLGQPIVIFARLFFRGKVFLDAFVSVYDVLCLDRKDFKPHSLVGRIAFWLDKVSFVLADKIITDTKASADFFSNLFQINRDKFYTVYTGLDEGIFYPRDIKSREDKFVVFFHGTFWPIHGIEYILKAAKLLEDRKDLLFILLGGGRKKREILALAKSLGLKNVEFVKWSSYADLAESIAGADICLGGHFSNTDKAKRVISGKTFMYLAMGKATIVGENAATRELFTHGKEVYMCPMADENSLAKGILELKENKNVRENLSRGGLKFFKNKCSLEKRAQELVEIIIGNKDGSCNF